MICANKKKLRFELPTLPNIKTCGYENSLYMSPFQRTPGPKFSMTAKLVAIGSGSPRLT